MGIFNYDKLPEYTTDFSGAEIVVAGGGAVGSGVVERAIKMGIENIEVIDFDVLEDDNLSKSSSLYRRPADVGKNKAVALAYRANELIGKDTIHGIDANITMFGPMAFAGYDAILAPFDNYAAKLYINQIWKQIPGNMRPELIFGGTIGENAQSNSLDGNGPCLRCLLSEEWLENPLVRTSCTGPQYRNEEQKQKIVQTSGLASGNSASFMVEQLRSRLLGINEAANKRIMYKPFPDMKLNVNSPMKRKNCPDCARYNPPENLACIDDCDVMTLNLKELFYRLDRIMHTKEYSIRVPRIEYAKVSYGGLIVSDYCRSCGTELDGLYRHEFRTRYSDLLCEQCKAKGKTTDSSTMTTHIGKAIRVIKREECDENLLSKTLFEIGWTIGGFIKAVVRNKACLDILDPGFEKEYTFYCENDAKIIKELSVLEG